MPSLSHMLLRSGSLSVGEREWIHQLVGDWQIIADISFADLLLAMDSVDGDIRVVAQCRPTTAQTYFETDIVGVDLDDDLVEAIRRTINDGTERTLLRDTFRLHLVPVRREGHILGVMCVAHGEVLDIVPAQVSSRADYATVSQQLIAMVTNGEFPIDGSATGYRHGTPRVVDGFVHLDPDGVVLYASPNAISNYHRIGIAGTIIGTVLAERITEVIEDHTVVEESLPVVVMGRAPWLTELEAHGVILSMRAVPLRAGKERLGGIVLCRDVTEIRRRDLELITKDATIREINHRVKNNLQTVSALLRMQSRRLRDNPEAHTALENAQRRVATIALVHQSLSQTINEQVDFNEVFGPLLTLASDIAAAGVPVTTDIEGDFGSIGAAKTTSLAVVLNELISNAVEHGLPDGGHISVRALREGGQLILDVEDNGVGIDLARAGKGLGTQIVRTLVEGELHGSIRWTQPDGGGTCVHIIADVSDGRP